MPIVDAFAQSKYERIQHETWGHLKPRPRQIYEGEILFSHSAYGCITPIRCEFKGLPDSPWFFEQMTDFIGDEIMARNEPGSVYKFVGTYQRFKNGKCKFSGTVTKIAI